MNALAALWVFLGFSGYSGQTGVDENRKAIGRLSARPASDPSLLGERLAARVGEATAGRLIAEALARSARHEVPTDVEDLLSFTKAHLIDDLVTAIGARAVPAFLDELREAARLRSGVRSTARDDSEMRAVVALLDRDVFRRANTARQLIARKLQVLAIHKVDDLITEGARPDVIILDEDAMYSPGLFRVLSLQGFDPAIVLAARDEETGRRALENAGVAVYEVTTTHTPVELAAATDRVLSRRR